VFLSFAEITRVDQRSFATHLKLESMTSENNLTLDFTPDEISTFRSETDGCASVIHLNNAGAGLMPNVVTRSVLEHTQLEANIGGYEAAALKQSAISEFYEEAAKLLNCKGANLAFTASATDSYTRALSSIPFQPGDIILTDNDDFISNQIQFLSCGKRLGVKIEHIRNAPGGGVDLNDLDEKLRKFRPRLLAITHIPTNSGLVQPVMEIGKVFEAYKQSVRDPLWYILDACQSVGQMKLDVGELKCDFLSATGRKFLRGPRGTGFLYVSDHALASGLEPMFIDMRGAEWIEKDVYKPRATAMRFEDWEFAYALLLGTAEAIRYCRGVGEQRIWSRIRQLSERMRTELSQIPRLRVLDRGPALGGLVTFTVQGSTPGYIVSELLKRKINVVPSYRNFAVLDFDEKGVGWAVRASPHYYNTVSEIDIFIDAVKEIVR
jgi:selenocysteine lyase/cysteine desulfurase